MKQKFRVAPCRKSELRENDNFQLPDRCEPHVGNYSGVTVERKSGICHVGDAEVEVIDLPGIYSLSSSSPEEKVAFEELMNEKIDLIPECESTPEIRSEIFTLRRSWPS